jgi:hypothetical protein
MYNDTSAERITATTAVLAMADGGTVRRKETTWMPITCCGTRAINSTSVLKKDMMKENQRVQFHDVASTQMEQVYMLDPPRR